MHSPLNQVSKLPSHAQLPYFFAKVAVLYVYYATIIHFGLMTRDWKFWSFVLITPAAKFYGVYDMCKDNKDIPKFIYGCLTDSLIAYFYYHVPTYYSGTMNVFLPISVVVIMIAIEFLCYRLFDAVRSTYEVKMSSNKPVHQILSVRYQPRGIDCCHVLEPKLLTHKKYPGRNRTDKREPFSPGNVVRSSPTPAPGS